MCHEVCLIFVHQLPQQAVYLINLATYSAYITLIELQNSIFPQFSVVQGPGYEWVCSAQ